MRSIELQRTLYSSLSNASRISARSRLSPFTSAALNPFSFRISRNFWLVFTKGRNTTVFLSWQYFAISSAIWYMYGSRAVAISPALKSPDCMETPVRSSFSGIVNALIGDKYPSRIAFGRVYSYARLSKYSPRFLMSPRSGVAVTPRTFASEKY